MFKIYAKLYALPYLFETLAQSIVELEHKTVTDNVEFEVDPNKVEEDADTISNSVSFLFKVLFQIKEKFLILFSGNFC